ncbi:MAG: DMT family transporter, partial [Isosphaeraceae bacterium]|nr:DMT family transporter [Isosphaeraceae bacterium]
LGAAAMGVVVLLSSPFQAHSTVPGQGLGDLVVITSGVIFAVQTIAQKLTFPKIPPATLLFAQSLLAIPAFFAYSGVVEGFSTYRLTEWAVGAVLYQGLGVSGVCFSTWLLLLRRHSASRLATIAFLTPLFGVGLGSLTRGEPLTWPLVLGGGLVGWGIYLTASDKTAHEPAPDLTLPGEDAP